jgi:hypothetical protein
MTEPRNPAPSPPATPASLHTAVGMVAQAGREQRCRAGCGRPLALMNERGTIAGYTRVARARGRFCGAVGAHSHSPLSG